MIELRQIKFEYFLYPLYEEPTMDCMQTFFTNGLPIQENRLATYRKNYWDDSEKTEEKLLQQRTPAIKGLAVIQIPQMFLMGLPECMSGDVKMNWKGFMPYLKRDTGTNDLHIIPQLIQGIFLPETFEYNPNPNQSIYYHGEGLLFDQSQIEQMRNLGFHQIASLAEQRLNIPYEFLLAQDKAGKTFSQQNEKYQELLFTDAYKKIRAKHTKPIKISNPN